MASEEDLATYFSAVLPRLHRQGTLGALLWSFADYAPELWSEPPCDEAPHERFFGLVRPDGSLKPHAEALRAFAAQQPTIQPQTPSPFTVDADTFYADPYRVLPELYQQYLNAQQEVQVAPSHT